ncbi:MAG: autotransporter outer membrane beta-barrel domain-containing protein [Melioribacteraceae bacterium]
MKNILIGILSLVFFVFINGCSSNTDPQFRIRNEQSNKVNVNVQTTGNNKLNINDIGAGQTTEYQKFSEGNITVTSVTQNESVSFLAAKNTRYTIVISSDQSPSVKVDY